AADGRGRGGVGRDRGGAAPSKLRRLGVVGANLRAEVLPGGGAPDFNLAIAGTERLAAEHAAARAAVHEIPAAREHRNLSSHLAYLDRASRFVNARLTCGASALWHPVERLLRMGVVLHRLFRCDARRGVCGKLTTPRRNLVIPTNLAVIGPWFAPPVRVGHRVGGVRMSSINSSWRAGGADRFSCHPRKVSSCGPRLALRLLAAALTAAALAACAQQPPPMVTHVSRPAAQEGARKAVARHRAPAASEKQTASAAAPKGGAGYGLASFYSYDPHTASGEKFNKNELTAAHRTLPFGTRLRVTDVDTGRSVTVRVNHRGPFARARVVDVAGSAAESLGITGKGVAKVKVDVVE